MQSGSQYCRSPFRPSDLKRGCFLEGRSKGVGFREEKPCVGHFGHQASRPETGYGYIQSSDTVVDDFTKVKTFTEKPDLELAKVFMESGEFFWNSGLVRLEREYDLGSVL